MAVLCCGDVGVWTSGSRLQPWIQPLELGQVFGTMASRREGWDWNYQLSGVILQDSSESDSAAGPVVNFYFSFLKVPALFGIDTRMLTKVIRDKVLQIQRPEPLHLLQMDFKLPCKLPFRVAMATIEHPDAAPLNLWQFSLNLFQRCRWNMRFLHTT